MVGGGGGGISGSTGLDDTVVVIGFVWFAAAVLLGFVTMTIWGKRGGSGPIGFLMGALLGVIGILIAALAQPSGPAKALAETTRECPHCKGADAARRERMPALPAGFGTVDLARWVLVGEGYGGRTTVA